VLKFGRKRANKAQREYEYKLKNKRKTIKNLKESLEFLNSQLCSIDSVEFRDELEKEKQSEFLSKHISSLNKRIDLCIKELKHMENNNSQGGK
jgi:hypothetical protein